MPSAPFETKFVFILLWLGFGKLFTISFFTLVTQLPLGYRLRVYAVPVSLEQTRRELRSAWLVFTDPVLLALLSWRGLIHFSEDTSVNVISTVLIFFVWAEVWFYWSHRLMHKSDWLWKIHKKHHLSYVTQPLTATSFSFTEKFVFYSLAWLGFVALISWHVPISLYGVVAFYTFYFVTSPLAHSNVELAPAWVLSLPFGLGKLLGTSTGHAIHHARAHQNYGFITSALDRLFGTYWANTDAIYERISKGKALKHLRSQTGS